MTMGIYNVKKGDTLSELAQRFNTTVENLVKLNNIKDPNSIFIGHAIKFEQDKCESWQDLDCDKKVSWQDFQGCSRYGIFLDKITSYIGKQWDEQIAGKYRTCTNNMFLIPKKLLFKIWLSMVLRFRMMQIQTFTETISHQILLYTL